MRAPCELGDMPIPNSIIDEIERIRRKNNTNWMDILRLAIQVAPTEAKQIVGKINASDKRISELLLQLSLIPAD